MQPLNFCTIFDSNYLSRGLLLYDSLKRCAPDAILYVFPFDEICFNILKEMSLPDVILIKMEALENGDSALHLAKGNRTRGEYCWTCTPSIIAYVLNNYSVTHCTYVDADMQFYYSPSLLIEEMPKESSVLITLHRYTKEYDQSVTSGAFCVQFLTFLNNNDSKVVLNDWRKSCNEWCYNRVEDGKFGDQKYLDEWPQKFGKIIWILDNPGGGIAPWNIGQYKVSRKEYGYLIRIADNQMVQMIFYHFHGLYGYKYCFHQVCLISYEYAPGYSIPKDVIRKIYRPYIKMLKRKEKILSKKYNLRPKYKYHSYLTIDRFLRRLFQNHLCL